MSVGWVAAGAGVVSSVIGSKASKKAASAQAQAAADAQALQQQQYEQTREDNAPFRERGNQAGNRLQYLLGLDKSTGQPGGFTEKAPTIEDAWAIEDQRHRARFGGMDSPRGEIQQGYADSHLARLQAEYNARKAQFEAQNPQTPEQTSEFGSLLRKFTMADRDADPVYQSGLEFGLSEGRRAVDNRFAAAGSSLSGAALKALTRFGNDYASTKAGESRNRYVQDQDATYNRLAGVAGTGQTATRDVSNAGANYANAAGNAIMGGGEARAAGYLGQANAFNTGVSQAIGGYQNNQLMELIRNPNGRNSMNNQLMELIRNPNGRNSMNNQLMELIRNPNGRNSMNNSIYSPSTGYGGWGGTSNEQFFYGNRGSGD